MGGNLLEVLILRDCMHLKEVQWSPSPCQWAPAHMVPQAVDSKPTECACNWPIKRKNDLSF